MKWKKENNCIPDEILQYFLDGELEQKELGDVKKHISECELCRSNFQEKRNFRKLLAGGSPTIEEDKITIPEFKPSISKVIDFQRKRNIYRWSAAAVFLLIVSIFVFYDSGKETFEMEFVYQEMSSEVDANTPWIEQTSTIYILNESGEIIDQI